MNRIKKSAVAYRSRLAAHDELQCRPAHDLLVGDITLIIRLSVQLHGLDINILRRDLGSQNHKGLAITYMHLHFREQRGADLILATDRINRVESHGAKHKPSGHLPTVLITANTVRGIQIQIM